MTEKSSFGGTETLLRNPDAPVLLVFGDSCRIAAEAAFKAYAVVSWTGSARAAKDRPWVMLDARRVDIWPDAGVDARKIAAQLVSLIVGVAARVRTIDPDGMPDGWNIEAAIADGWTPERLQAYAREHLHESKPPIPVPAKTARPKHKADYIEASAVVDLADMDIARDHNQKPLITTANASLIIQQHPRLFGKIWYDTFHQKIFHSIGGERLEWTDADDLDLLCWMQQSLHLSKFSLTTVRDALAHAARQRRVNSLTEWLDSLVWDGVPRLDDWLVDCLGVPKTPHTVAVSRNWPISMVARAYRPGCKCDTMPVLEGNMGRGKSSFLDLIGGEWYAALSNDFGSKDFLQDIQGRWLVEVPDMAGFSKREHTFILSVTSRRTDRYRAAYGRNSEDHPRVAVFACTSETDDYLQDSRGRRRYLPLRCGHINLDAAHQQRPQVFAEAVALFRGGASWYEFPESTLDEQSDRVSDEPWEIKIRRYLEPRDEVRVDEILSSDVCLNIPAERQDRRCVLRVAAIMRELGWEKCVSKTLSRESYKAWRRAKIG